MERVRGAGGETLTIAMKSLALAFVGALWMAASTADTPSDETAVRQALIRACDAFRDGDVAHLSAFLSKDFTLTSSSGEVTNYEQNLAEVRTREPRYDVFNNHDMSVRLYGDTAVVNGITSVKGTSGGKPFAADFLSPTHWSERAGDGRLWRATHLHCPGGRVSEARAGTRFFVRRGSSPPTVASSAQQVRRFDEELAAVAQEAAHRPRKPRRLTVQLAIQIDDVVVEAHVDRGAR